jgi:hypothetical protein
VVLEPRLFCLENALHREFVVLDVPSLQPLVCAFEPWASEQAIATHLLPVGHLRKLENFLFWTNIDIRAVYLVPQQLCIGNFSAYNPSTAKPSQACHGIKYSSVLSRVAEMVSSVSVRISVHKQE